LGTTASPRKVLFEKYEGLRNDFLLVDEREGGAEPALSLEERIALCDRHAGPGADGVLTVLPKRSPDALVRMHITNSDGSIPEMCGNGLRCLGLWLVDHGAVSAGESFVVDTDAGPHEVKVLGDGGGVRVQMRHASFDDVVSGGEWRHTSVEAEGEAFDATAVSVGNPHLVLRAPADLELARRVGPVLEKHPRFAAGANIGFAQVRGSHEVDLVVWERGAGLTQACGTGACACVAALVDAGACPADEDVAVHLPGGALRISVSADFSRVRMTGPARRVYRGEAEL
jgi:diaminopimelate epimerase